MRGCYFNRFFYSAVANRAFALPCNAASKLSACNFYIGEFDILDFGTFVEKTEKPLLSDINLVDADTADGMAIAIELAIEWMIITISDCSDCGVVVFLFGTFVGVSDVLDNFKVRI